MFLCTFVGFIFRCDANLQVTVTRKNRQHFIYVLAQEWNKSLPYMWLLNKFCPSSLGMVVQRRSQGGVLKGLKHPHSDQNIDVYFLVFHQRCTVSRDRVHCKMFFGSPTGVATHSLSNQAAMNFRDLRNIEAAFFIPACFALPYITRAGCCRALPVWKQA